MQVQVIQQGDVKVVPQTEYILTLDTEEAELLSAFILYNIHRRRANPGYSENWSADQVILKNLAWCLPGES